MGDAGDSGLTEGGGTGGRERPPFDSLMGIHRRAAGFYRLLAGLLIVGGLALLAVAPLLDGPAAYPPAALGVFLVSLAAIPWREVVERRDRIQGLGVLRDEWDQLAGQPGDGAPDRLRALLTELYRLPA